jgi:hypothetical protein
LDEHEMGGGGGVGRKKQVLEREKC